ncbi:MAG: hypothetical protein CML38_07420 [Rhodobacteraceae bacterium]|nr:MAG: hypothetical protein CML38_07420 [Paracoccaceae bacterium]
MEKPLRSKYGTLKISSVEIEAQIEVIIFVFYLRWLLAAYPLGFYGSYTLLAGFNPFSQFFKYGMILGTVFSITLLLFSYIIFIWKAKRRKTFLESEKIHALKFESDIRNWRIETLEAEPLYWRKYSGLEFEQAVFSLFRKIGWEVSRTFVTGDGGINISGTDGSKKIKIICPQTKLKVDISHLRNALAIKLENDIDDMFIIASPIGFTSESIDLANKNNVILLDPEDLSKLAQGQFKSSKSKLKVI